MVFAFSKPLFVSQGLVCKYRPYSVHSFELCVPQYAVLNLVYILQFWRGTLGEANEAFASRQPKGEITVLIEGQLTSVDETPSDDFLEHELRELMTKGHTLSAVHIQLDSLLHF